MNLFGIHNYTETDKPLRRDCLLLFVKSDNGNGVSFFIPWMIHGEYYPQCSNVMRFGWRCARVNMIFGMKFKGKVTKLIKFIFYLEEI